MPGPYPAGRLLGRLGQLLGLGALGLLLLFNLRLHLVPGPADVDRQLGFLSEALDQGQAEAMQRLFPEGYFFTHVLVALTELALADGPEDPRAPRALAAAARARQALLTPRGRAPFDPALDPPHGVFYNGWLAWLEVETFRVSRTSSAALEARLSALAVAFQRDGPFLDAYPGQAWPCDSLVALAALARRDQLLPPRYSALRARLVDQMQGHGLLLPHRVRPAQEGPRATSAVLMQRFLPIIDAAWSERSYPEFRRQFVTTILGLPGVYEHPGGGGEGDVDSGPLLFGVSMSSTVLGLGAARAHGDEALAEALAGTMEAFGLPLGWQQKRYALGILPVGDAFIAWAEAAPRGAPRAQAPLGLSTLPVHALSMLAAAGLGLALLPRRRRTVQAARPAEAQGTIERRS